MSARSVILSKVIARFQVQPTPEIMTTLATGPKGSVQNGSATLRLSRPLIGKSPTSFVRIRLEGYAGGNGQSILNIEKVQSEENGPSFRPSNREASVGRRELARPTWIISWSAQEPSNALCNYWAGA